MASITLSGLTVVKDGRTVLDDVDLRVDDGELVAVIGRSGSGKTSLLRAVAGLDRVAAGQVRLGEEIVTGLEPRDRQVAMVFQDAVLYPFLSARDNVAFPLNLQHRPAAEVELRVSAEGRALGIERMFDAKPAQLSAGHRQLVQVARAMVRVPQALLLDEPLAMVDPQARAAMRAELRTLQQGYGVTALYVTNDPVEAMAMGDRVAVMGSGRVVQVGSPTAVYARPDTVDVAEVIGEMSLLDAAVLVDPPGYRLVTGSLRLRAWAPALAHRVGTTVTLGIRPEDVALGGDPGDGDGPFPGLAERIEPVGHHDFVTVDVGGAMLRSLAPPGSARGGDAVGVTVRRHVVFDRDDGRRIA